ncbi:unnamed protein product [Rotaria sp. Silwood1]|nr:unnamed protein product [Rotaria sp. Silwood1]CAF1508543.1 unnamed protein product [Rotaria sp. Silwood1]CAF1511422.1 unnamed protein product [Rotaria sp. Silwood1]CAF3659382.1 unnamed protein product [Rotaria sp. Silwood1]CAF3662227.1 unnamed protein product [Rotaria sp. Silwood1]
MVCTRLNAADLQSIYMKLQSPSLVVAFKDLSHFRRQILAHNAIRLLKNSTDANGLSKEEIATIKLYVSCFFLYLPLNEALRSEQYEQIKPWLPYLKLFHNAIYKLPERAGLHCRVVSGNIKIDLYRVDSFVIWVSNKTERFFISIKVIRVLKKIKRNVLSHMT